MLRNLAQGMCWSQRPSSQQVQQTPDMMAEGGGVLQLDSTACSLMCGMTTSTVSSVFSLCKHDVNKANTDTAEFPHVRHCSARLLLNPNQFSLRAEVNGVSTTLASQLTDKLQEEPRLTFHCLQLLQWLSARRIDTQYIVCIGLFKHCKRIHSTESYFQKVALCILFIIFPLSSNGRSCVSVCVCWLLIAALLVVCVSETWPSV